jgi:hypothetical protein
MVRTIYGPNITFALYGHTYGTNGTYGNDVVKGPLEYYNGWM